MRALAVAFLLLVAALSAEAGSAVCGNSIREFGEQCDDGNAASLDGCSATCGFEQAHRVRALKLQRLTGANCSANAFGGALTEFGLSQMQPGIDQGVADGQTSIMFTMHGLDDLSGTNDDAVEVGIINGTPVAAPGYSGVDDLDWWYSPDVEDIDSSGNPISSLSGAIAGALFTAGPGRARLDMIFAGVPASFQMSQLRLRATSGLSSSPLLTETYAPPGHHPTENLDPLLTSYASSGAEATGELCGNLGAGALAQTPIPESLVGSGFGRCQQGYTLSNTLLDVWIRGCSMDFVGILISASQPDQTDSNQPAAGAGPPYTLSAATASKIVDTCRDKNSTIVDFQTCLAHVAYSSFWKIETGRVLVGAPACSPAAPVASNDGAVCPGESIHLSADGTSGTYSWTGPNGFTSSQQSPTISDATAAMAGVYEVTVTVAGCTSPAGTTTVTVKPAIEQPEITAPQSVAPGATGVIASVASNEGSSYTWSIMNGSITGGQGSPQITFTAGTTGSVTLRVFETLDGCNSPVAERVVSIFGPPQNVVATAVSANEVAVSWSAVGGAAAYEIVRTGANGVTVLGPAETNSWNDTTAAAGAAYFYSVVAIDGSNNRSASSAADIATTVMFDDDTLTAGTPIRAIHLLQLQNAIDAVRDLAGLDSPSFFDIPAAGGPIKAVHLAQLRTALDEALGAFSYTNPAAAGGTVRAVDQQEMRDRVK